MNTKRKNNNFNTVKNDKKNNTYAIVLCVLIFFWTIASFLGTIAFFRSFNDDDTMVASADTATFRVADIDMSHFTVERFGNFQVPIMKYLDIYQTDSIYNPTMQYYILFEDNIPVGVSYNSGLVNGYFHYNEGDIILRLQDIVPDEYNLIMETPLWEDGYDYWSEFFEGAIYVDSLQSLFLDDPSSEYAYYYVGYQILFGSTNSDTLFNVRVYNDVNGFSVEEDFTSYDTAFYSQIGSYANYSKWLEGYNAGYSNTQTDINNARQEGYNQGYVDGLNTNKYGPFSNMEVTAMYYDLYDIDGAIITPIFMDYFRSIDIPNAFFSIGFNGERFYTEYAYSNLIYEYPNYSSFNYVALAFDFQSSDFSTNTYPLRFYVDSSAIYESVFVRYIDGTEVDYYFITNYDDVGNVYYTLPFDSAKSIDEFILVLRGDRDIISSLSISVYGQAYQEGYNAGVSVGYNNGYYNGKDVGYEEGYYGGYNNGKHQGFLDGVASANEYSFLGLLTSVVDAPLKVFYDMFDFEILGYNMSSFFIAVLSICIVIAVVKVILAR